MPIDEDIAQTNGMHGVERVSFEPFAKLLKQAAPTKTLELEQLISGFSPFIEIDRTEDRLLFQADCSEKLIRVGVKCTCRLQAHAYAAAVILEGLRQSEIRQLSKSERRSLFHPADQFLNWAVARDIQQWLKQTDGVERPLDSILRNAGNDVSPALLSSLTREQRVVGEGLFRLASAFILLHEIGHSALSHSPGIGLWSIEQEREADRFAAGWLIDAASEEHDTSEDSRLSDLFAIAVALIWLTVGDVYLGGQRPSTHPEAYDRLYQTLNQFVDPHKDLEYQGTWRFVATMLYLHMSTAAYKFRAEDFFDDPRAEVDHLINRLSREAYGEFT